MADTRRTEEIRSLIRKINSYIDPGSVAGFADQIFALFPKLTPDEEKRIANIRSRLTAAGCEELGIPDINRLLSIFERLAGKEK